MRQRPWRYLGVMLVLSACQVPVVDTPKPDTGGKRLERTAPKASVSPSASAAAAASPAPSTAPSVTASAAASAAPAALALLQKPTGQTRLVSGQVAIDAHYARAAGGGQIISQNGARAIAFGQSSLLGNNGGNLISNNGGALIGKVKAPVVGLISDKGLGLISDKGLGFRVLQADATEAAPAVGEILPAAGLALKVFSLRTAGLLSLGVDDQGQPVYEVYSNAKGEYQLYIPESEIDNVLLVATVPGGTDTRLDYSLLVPKDEARQTLDEDTSLVANFLRKSFADVMFQDVELFFKELSEGMTVEQSANGNVAQFPEFMREPARQVRMSIINAALAAGARNYDKRQRQILAQRINDAILAYLKLGEIKTEYKTYGLTTPETAALPALVEVFRRQRESVVKTFQRFETEKIDPAPYFAAKPYMETVKNSLGVTFTIKSPADALAFTSYGILANVQIDRPEALALYEEVMTSADYGMPVGTANQVFAAAQPFYTAYLLALYMNPTVSEAVIKAIEQGVDEP